MSGRVMIFLESNLFIAAGFYNLMLGSYVRSYSATALGLAKKKVSQAAGT
jgi:hypothetical protein